MFERSRGPKTRKKRKRPPAPIGESDLREQALDYLDRGDSSSGRVKKVLLRRVKKYVAFHGGDWTEHLRVVEAVVARLVAADLINDPRFARRLAEQLKNRGDARVIVERKLARRDLSHPVIREATAAVFTSARDELTAACAYLRRRRLGPCRRDGEKNDEDPKRRQRDYAAMIRAGFGFDVTRQILECRSLEELELLEEEA